jgi:hypothetical protein
LSVYTENATVYTEKKQQICMAFLNIWPVLTWCHSLSVSVTFSHFSFQEKLLRYPWHFVWCLFHFDMASRQIMLSSLSEFHLCVSSINPRWPPQQDIVWTFYWNLKIMKIEKNIFSEEKKNDWTQTVPE